jgi:hypothetical protein
MLELTIISPYFHSRVNPNTFTKGNPMSESNLAPMPQSTYLPVRDFGVGPCKQRRLNSRRGPSSYHPMSSRLQEKKKHFFIKTSLTVNTC